MVRKAARSIALSLLVVSIAVAASPVGRWGGIIDAGGTPLEAFYNFTVDGELLNGTMELPEHGAEFPILDGKAQNDSVSFMVDFAGMATLQARGRVAGDTLFLMADFGSGETPSVLLRVE